MEDVPPHEVPYDALIVAAGSKYSYFGHEEWAAFAPEVKSLERALEVRGRILAAFEAAELEERPGEARRVADLRGRRRGPDRRRDGGPDRRARARHAAARLPLHRPVRGPDPARGGRAARARRLPARPVRERRAPARAPRRDHDGQLDGGRDRRRTGVELASRRAASAGGSARAPSCGRRGSRRPASPGASPRRRAPRSTAPGGSRSSPTCRCPGIPRCWRSATWRWSSARTTRASRACPASRRWRCSRGATRHAACCGGWPARRSSRSATSTRATSRRSGAPTPWPRSSALHFGGALAWLLWLGIHIFYLIGFQNRLLVLLRWSFSFMTRGRGARLITGEATPRVVRVSTPHE